MRIPDIKTGDATLLGLGTYTVAKLKANNDTKDLVAILQPTMDVLRAAGEGRGVAELLVMTRMALRDTTDYEADELVRVIYYDVKGLEGGSRPGPRGKLLFPKGLNAITGGPIPEQPGMMHTLAGVLESDELPQLAGRAEAVRAKAEELTEKVAAFDDSTDQAAVAYSEVLRARAGFIRAYEKVYAQLIDRVGKRRAETFFKKATKKRKPK